MVGDEEAEVSGASGFEDAERAERLKRLDEVLSGVVKRVKSAGYATPSASECGADTVGYAARWLLRLAEFEFKTAGGPNEGSSYRFEAERVLDVMREEFGSELSAGWFGEEESDALTTWLSALGWNGALRRWLGFASTRGTFEGLRWAVRRGDATTGLLMGSAWRHGSERDGSKDDAFGLTGGVEERTARLTRLRLERPEVYAVYVGFCDGSMHGGNAPKEPSEPSASKASMGSNVPARCVVL
jgi:hypothetical protein